MALRTPDFGNRWSTRFDTVVHRNASGALRMFQRSVNQPVERFDFIISANKRVDVDAFVAAFIAACGDVQTYTDFEGTIWTGFYDLITVSCGRNNCDSQIAFSFEGIHS